MNAHSIKQSSIALLLILFFAQCRTMKSYRHDKNQFKTVYLHQFKLDYTRKLLQAGFNHSEAIKSVLSFDHSGFSEPILSDADYHLIDSLVYQDNLNMMADSTNSIGKVAEGAEGKHILSCLIDKYEGKWIDSLAKVRYKRLEVKKFR